MAANPLLNFVKQLLPAPLLHVIRRIRTTRHREDPEIARLRKRHLSYQSTDPNEITLRPGVMVRIDPESRAPFECFCFRSPEMTRELDSFIKNAAAFSSFVDVGANHGIFSLAFCALRSDGRVLAVDPSPIAFEILQKNLNLNSFSQLQARKIACGAAPGKLRMKRNWHHLEVIRDVDNADAVVVPMLSLDQICEEEDILPEVLKIDVEGFELPVLQGAERVLQSASLLFLEVHPEAIDELGISRQAIFDLLTSSGWCGYALKESPLTREDFIAQIDVFRTIWRKHQW